MAGFVEQPENVIQSNKAAYRPKKALMFPEDLGAHCMVLNFETYNYATTGATTVNSVTGESIILPIPGNLSDDMSIDAQSGDLGMTGALAQSLFNNPGGTVDDIVGGLKSTFDNIKAGVAGGATGVDVGDTLKEALGNYAAFAKFLGRGALDTLFPGAGLAANQISGTAVNPYSTIDFNGVRLKTHSFNWTFSPKSENESNKLRDIIKTIKRKSLPRYESVAGATDGTFSRALLTYPNLVNISFQGINQDYYYKFKKCMIQNFNVSYNSGNQLQVFEGGKPVVVTASMQLIEAAIHTSNDY